METPVRRRTGVFFTLGRGTGETKVQSGARAVIQGVLPCGGRGWGGPGSSGTDIRWLRALRGTGDEGRGTRHAVPRAWPPPTKFRDGIWGVGQVVVPYGWVRGGFYGCQGSALSAGRGAGQIRGFCPMTEECGTGYGVRGLAEGPARVLVGGGGFLRRTV